METLESTTTTYPSIVKKAFQAFFSPSQYEVKSVDREIIAAGNNTRIPFVHGDLAVTTWGERGPAVLLMHGWSGARGRWRRDRLPRHATRRDRRRVGGRAATSGLGRASGAG